MYCTWYNLSLNLKRDTFINVIFNYRGADIEETCDLSLQTQNYASVNMENYASSALSTKLTINVIHDSLYVTDN